MPRMAGDDAPFPANNRSYLSLIYDGFSAYPLERSVRFKG